MREADFEVLLRLVERLDGEQRAALGRALAAASGEPEAVRLFEGAFAAAPRCPHCATARPQRWGQASGLRRYRCKGCRKTFNALTGTSLARLRKKACWLRYGEALAAGMSLAQGGRPLRRAPDHQFPLAHRFLRAPAATREALGGVVEADETFFRRSHKGSRRWRRGDAPPGPAATPARRAGKQAGSLGPAGPGPDRPRPRRPHRRCRAARPGCCGHRGGARARGRRRCRALLGRCQGLRRLRRRARASATSRSMSRPASGSATAPSTSRT